MGSDTVELKKTVGFWTGTSLIVGTIIGEACKCNSSGLVI